ncbi:MAG: histidine triad nucleotide-binding protein [Clostridia bacterium]|nr:histidine triad nucleotide-binding protein [Clostridia bacterium]
MDCIFCKIIAGEIPCDKVYEDEKVLCFNDIAPKAPIHVLAVPKKHTANLLEVGDDKEMLNDINYAIKKVAEKMNIAENGFKTVINTGTDGGQSVNHLHFHILGGKKFGEDL